MKHDVRWLAGVIDKGCNIRPQDLSIRITSADIDLIREVIKVVGKNCDLSWVANPLIGGKRVADRKRLPQMVLSGHGSPLWRTSYAGGNAVKVLRLVYPLLHPVKQAKADLLFAAMGQS